MSPTLVNLLRGEAVGGGRVSAKVRQDLGPLLRAGIVTEAASGRGTIVRVSNHDLFKEWIERRHPSAAGWASTAGVTTGRANAVARSRSSKRGGALVGSSVLLFRAPNSGAPDVSIDGVPLDVGGATRTHGVAACLVRDGTRLDAGCGPILVLENLECFLHAEMLVPDCKVALFGNGRLPGRVVRALARTQAEFLHLPDYDPVGLSEYIRLRRELGERVRLHIPDNLDDFFRCLSDPDLLRRKPANQVTLAAIIDSDLPCPESRHVHRLIRQHGAGLEQEALLLRRV